ncbi:hypothetical protein CAPN010_12910 [Capnocytophaga cynodegmi]|uniref:hypothetical protein n=1 Tax=Capnocytophaga cynodegmi TaxID=28189 RepID=UPI001EE26926|nr:hypothetical protein [Capnocytophaga cynodegmi]GJQ07133.1 hypothetical protein CAPN010_12910 [Capnocytophaga cynodegmi]
MEFLDYIIKNNPGIVTTFVTGVLLPLLILGITSWQNIKLKKFDLEKEKLVLGLDINSSTVKQEKIVYSSLIKILFEVQKLHIELSSKCLIDYSCISKSVEKFQVKFSEYQEIISDNQIYLKLKVTNELYGFYQELANLLIELKEIENKKKYDLAVVSVFLHSQVLASIILKIQKELSYIQKELKYEVKEEDMYKFIYCCGKEPNKEDIEEYKKMNPLSRGILTYANASYGKNIME